MVITMRVSPDGRVFHARIKEGRMTSPIVQKCILDELRTIQFAPPAGGYAEVDVPVRFATSHEQDDPKAKK